MALGVFVLFAGMLFWTKLRLVSDIPRSAYAVPKELANRPVTPPETAPDSAANVADDELERDGEAEADAPLHDNDND